ncbi:unnamed protein product [Peniophora sp. CBMAI 1063]|nr:unnamed protein product [Peniophora sp. CBMAI 1063]
MGYTGAPGLSTQLKNAYTRVILRYEEFQRHVKASPALAPTSTAARDPDSRTHAPPQASASWTAASTATAVSTITASFTVVAPENPLSDDLSEIEVEDDKPVSASRSRRSTRGSSLDMTPSKKPMSTAVPPPQPAKIATTHADRDRESDEESGEQTCEVFHSNGNGNEMLLCDGCDCGTHPPDQAKHDPGDAVAYKYGEVTVMDNDVENEFWRLGEDPNDTVDVDPTPETHPSNPYAKDPWNLNSMFILPDSLLRYIKSDITSMTVLWIYVGTVFSTFYSHNEDHHTYGVNFMHWGETKTWYGMPGADTQKFEAAIKSEAPGIFEAQPDLLFQLVTLMKPDRLPHSRRRDTQGLHFNEAVIFALPDWLDFGCECIQRYREHRKQPVFSHDELLITITYHSQTIATAMWLKDSLLEMTNRERANQAKVRSLKLQEVLEQEDRPEDQYRCTVCKVFCYLSQITCGCTNSVVCADHADQLCSCATDQRALRLRFSDAEVSATAVTIEERAHAPVEWVGRLNAPTRRTRGSRQVHTFEASRSVGSANAILKRKPSVNGTSSRSANTPTLAYVQHLMITTRKLGFETPEIASLEKASVLNIAIPAVDELANLLQREEVPSELCIEVEDNAMSVIEVSTSLARVASSKRQSWEERARHVLPQPCRTIDELACFLDTETTIYIEVATETRLKEALGRARKYESQAKVWRDCQAYPQKPSLSEVEQMVTASQKEFSIAAVDEVKDLLNRAKGIEGKCDEALNRRYKLNYTEDLFDIVQK